MNSSSLSYQLLIYIQLYFKSFFYIRSCFLSFLFFFFLLFLSSFRFLVCVFVCIFVFVYLILFLVLVCKCVTNLFVLNIASLSLSLSLSLSTLFFIEMFHTNLIENKTSVLSYLTPPLSLSLSLSLSRIWKCTNRKNIKNFQMISFILELFANDKRFGFLKH